MDSSISCPSAFEVLMMQDGKLLLDATLTEAQLEKSIGKHAPGMGVPSKVILEALSKHGFVQRDGWAMTIRPVRR